MTGNTDRCATIGDARGEGTDMASLMTTSETELVVLAVNSDVLVVPLRQLLNSRVDSLDSSGFTHLLSAEVGVATSTVPVTLEGFGVEGDLDTPLLGDTDEEVTGHPEVVTHGDTLTWSDLELPLRGHDFCVDTRDVNTGVEAGTVVGLNQVTSEDLASTCQNRNGREIGVNNWAEMIGMEVRTSSAVVRTLGAGETTFGPTVGGTIGVEKGVFLLKTEPGFDILSKVHDLLRVVAVVGPVRGAIVVVALCEDEDVVTATERILEDGSGAKVDV